jgi:hypothetical protein
MTILIRIMCVVSHWCYNFPIWFPSTMTYSYVFVSYIQTIFSRFEITSDGIFQTQKEYLLPHGRVGLSGYIGSPSSHTGTGIYKYILKTDASYTGTLLPPFFYANPKNTPHKNTTFFEFSCIFQ